jgi:hypothetical protein
MTTEDDVLEEFGFNPRQTRRSRAGRGRVINMVGKQVKNYRCIQRHPESAKSGETRWIVKCVGCGQERTENGNKFRKGLKCFTCDGKRKLNNPNVRKNLPNASAMFPEGATIETVVQLLNKAFNEGNKEMLARCGMKVYRMVLKDKGTE